MSRFWNENTKKIVPYTPGEQPESLSETVKLNTNENPYGPSPKAAEALRTLDFDILKRYPNPDAKDAIKTFAKMNGLDEKNVFAGNGSDEVLAFSFKAFFDGKKKVYFPDITYSFYSVYCDLFGVKYGTVPLKEDFYPDVDALCNVKGGVVIANPNAPTSIGMPLEDVVKIIEAHKDDVVIVDEAYVEFGGESAIGLIGRYDNLLVVRTMSKSYSLAGMRVGFAAGGSELIEGLNRVKNSFNSYTVDRLACIAATESLKDEEYHKETLEKVVNTRDRVKKALEKLGFEVKKSSANFLFAANKSINAADYYEYLKDHGILIRYFAKPGIDSFVRISIGTDDEMDKFLRETEVYLNEKSANRKKH
ncbi:MAG: histidinol-phosphate transaminase [Clostridia bacterium]|jgi:histidinol-phosphate aminotransferase|nr:histidinol-phosphate transaminase [Clostridia bacterium]